MEGRKMKKYVVWLGAIWKQKCRQLSFWGILFLFLFLCIVGEQWKTEERTGVDVYIYMEPAVNEEKMMQEKLHQLLENKKNNDDLINLIILKSSDFISINPQNVTKNEKYQLIGNDDPVAFLQEKVANGEAECGYVLAEDLFLCMEKGIPGITVYTSPESSMAEVIHEQIFAVVFQVYSGNVFARYVENNEMLYADYEEAQAAYERRLSDGSTFQFVYTQDIEERSTTDNSEATPKVAFFNKIFGLFLVLMLFAGIIDKKKNHQVCVRIFQGRTFVAGIMEMMLPVFIVACVGMVWRVCSAVVGATADNRVLYGKIDWARECGALLLFLCLLVIYGILLDIIFKNMNIYLASIPILLIATIVICPVFLDLAEYVKGIGVLQKAFPLTYYLVWI